MATEKKRSINEYRQTKEYYTPPASHLNDNFIEHRFTNKKLFEYMETFMLDTFYDDDDVLPQSLLEELEHYINNTPKENIL